MPRKRWIALLVVLTAYALFASLVQPSNDLDWSPDQARAATAVIDGNSVVIRNVRNALYRSATDFDVHWEEGRFDFGELTSVWFIVEPFASWRGPAHTFLSFASPTAGISRSPSRPARSEAFSPLKGLLRQLELSCVIGDERDLVGLHANHRRDAVYLYPIRASTEQRRALLLSVLERVSAVAARPEFYNTLTNNCTSSIVQHIEEIVRGRIPFSCAS